MKRALLALAGMLALATTVRADAPQLPAMIADTAEVIVVDVDNIPQVVLFVSVRGEAVALTVDACRIDPSCVALGAALAKVGKVGELNLKGGTGT